MNDIIDEVSSEDADEKKLKYFKRILPWVIGSTISVIVIMTVYDYRAKNRIEYNKNTGDMLVKAMSVDPTENNVVNEALSHLAKESENGLSDIASLEKIAIILKDHNKKAALLELESLVSKAKVELTESYAKIVWMSIISDEEKISDREKDMMETNLNSFKDDNKEFFGTAQVLGAIFHAKHNKLDEAKSALHKVIASENVPSLVKDQARALQSNLQ